MSVGSIVSAAFGILMPICLAFGCVSEFLAARLAGDVRCDKARLKKLYIRADNGNILAWVFLIAGIVSYKLSGAAADYERVFETVMSWALAVLLLADVYFLNLRRNRAPEYKGRKRFGEKR